MHFLEELIDPLDIPGDLDEDLAQRLAVINHSLGALQLFHFLVLQGRSYFSHLKERGYFDCRTT